MTADEKKRLYMIVGVLFVIVAAIGAALIFLGGDDEKEGPSVREVIVSPADNKAITEVTTDFLQAAGNYGFTEGSVTEKNVLKLFRNSDNPPSDIFINRQQAYNNAAQYFARTNNLGTAEVGRWSNSPITDSLTSVTMKVEEVKIPKEGFIQDSLPTVVVDVSYTTTVTSTIPDANDSSSKGLFYTNEASGEVSTRITLVRDDLGWRLQNVDAVDIPISLAIYEDADTGALPVPVQVDTLTPPVQDTAPNPEDEVDDGPLPPN